MTSIGAFVAALHNEWLKFDPGVRAAVSFSGAVLVATAIGLIQAFGWFIPGSVADAKGEVIVFLTYAVPVLAVLAAQLVRSRIAPAVVRWFLTTFGFGPASKVQTAHVGGLKRGDIWVRY